MHITVFIKLFVHFATGHGNTSTQKTPTRVHNIEPVKQVACGAAHTLALAVDGVTVWSFGSGDSGKLGHGDRDMYSTPKVRGLACVCVCQIVVSCAKYNAVEHQKLRRKTSSLSLFTVIVYCLNKVSVIVYPFESAHENLVTKDVEGPNLQGSQLPWP